MKLLVELRPALDGFSGIPQETRLVFRGLQTLDGFQVEGLIQSSNLRLEPGLPIRTGEMELDHADRYERLSKVVVSLQQHQDHGRIGNLLRRLQLLGTAMAWGAFGVVGVRVPLTGFHPERFEDFIWRGLFAKSLPPDDRIGVLQSTHRLLQTPWSVAHAVGASTARFGFGAYPRLNTDGVDVLLAETPFPARVAKGTRLVVRYHDAMPILMPHTVKNMVHHRAAHLEALRRNVKDGAWFACVSDSARRDLIAVMPAAEPRALTIPNMVPHHYRDEPSPPSRVTEILHKLGRPPVTGAEGLPRFLLMVGTVEPRKNHLTLIDAWERLRQSADPALQLVLVGSLGWECADIARRIEPWIQRGQMHLLQGVPASDLRVLYKHAALTVCPSFAEGFDFPGVEAMQCGGVVLASDIPVHREVFADASAYFDTYSAEHLASQAASLMTADAAIECHAMRQRGIVVSGRYLPEQVLNQWKSFLLSLQEPHPDKTGTLAR